MAKKKRKRHPQRPRPQSSGGTAVATAEPTEAERSPSKRAERKEEARRERERRIKQARRRRRNRRLIRWGTAVGVVGLIAGGIYLAGGESRDLERRAGAAAGRVNAAEVETEPDLPAEHVEPFAAGVNGVPAVGGNHSSNLPPEPKVYTQQPPEESVIHNFEHGYVAIYYAEEGENALDPKFVSALEDLVNGESEVFLSPYEGLAQPLYLTAWGARQAVDPPTDASVEDVTLVAQAFIDEWKNGQFAPEPSAP